MESFKPLHTNFTKPEDNQIIKVYVSDIINVINDYDNKKGIWRRWSWDHEDITALKNVLREDTNPTDVRLLGPNEMHKLLCVFIKQYTLQNTLSSDIFLALYNKIGPDLISFSRLLYRHDETIFTPHIISLLSRRKDNFDVSNVKSIVKLFIDEGIDIKDHICSICSSGVYSKRFGNVLENLKIKKNNFNVDGPDEHTTRVNLLECIIQNSSCMSNIYNWSLLDTYHLTLFCLKTIISIEQLINRIEKQSDNEGLINCQIRVLFEKECAKFEALELDHKPSMKNLWEKAKAIQTRLSETNILPSIYPMDETKASSPIGPHTTLDKRAFAKKLESVLFLSSSSLRVKTLLEASDRYLVPGTKKTEDNVNELKDEKLENSMDESLEVPVKISFTSSIFSSSSAFSSTLETQNSSLSKLDNTDRPSAFGVYRK